MELYDYIYLGLCFIVVVLLIMQIANIRLTKKQNKSQLSNAKFKIGQKVLGLSVDNDIYKLTIVGIVVRKDTFAYETNKIKLCEENQLYANYEELKKDAIKSFTNDLDKKYAKL